MVKSMTGFGKSQINDCGYQVTCEIKSVNHRFFDSYIRMPRRYSILEDQINKELKRYVKRGRLETSINVEKIEASESILKVDKDLVIAYHNYLKEIAENLNISDEIKVIDLFRLPEVIRLEAEKEDLDIVWQVIRQAVDTSMESLLGMRLKEGQNLAQDIVNRNMQILYMVEQLEERSSAVVPLYRDKLRARIAELAGAEILDEQRLMQEAAILADKSSITEEIVRLKSHIGHLGELMTSEDAVGRKCDFLVQEMLREINTVASKANDFKISKIVIEVKTELEKIREQLQNIE